MHIPVITPLTPELFAALFELEAQAASLKGEFEAALAELKRHVKQMRQRIEAEKKAIAGRLAELEEEETRLKATMQAAAKERAKAALQRREHQDGAELQAAKMRLLELPAEREALHELMSDAAITPEEKTRYGELYGAAAKAGKAVDLVTRKRKAEIDRIFPIFKDQYDAGTWSGGAFALDELSRIETAVYNMQEVTLYGKKI